MLIEIKSRFNSAILFRCKAENIKEALEKAIVGGIKLMGADLRDANLRDADLFGERLVITPISCLNLTWDILITAEYMTIGCQRHTHQEWSSFTTKQITEMADSAGDFWKSNKTWLLAACKAHKKEALKVRKGEVK